MKSGLKIEEIKDNYIIPKDCVIMERHDYDMLMYKFYNNNMKLRDYANRVHEARDYLESKCINIINLNEKEELLKILRGLYE